MNARSTLILLAVLTVLVGAYWLMLRSEEHSRTRDHEARRIAPFEIEDITRIAIAREDGDPVAAERDSEGRWRIVEPYEVEAAQRAWNRVAARLTELVNERTITEDPEDLGMYGLDEAEVAITAAAADGQEVSVRFGAMEPTQTQRYALSHDGAVFLASVDAFREFDRGLLDLRQRYLVDVGDKPVTRLEYARIRPQETGAIVFEWREDSEKWHITAPFDTLGEQELIEQLVDEVRYAAGMRYIDEYETLEDYGLDPPGALVRVANEDYPEGTTVYLGSYTADPDENGIYAWRDGADSVAVIDAGIVGMLPESPDAFRERRLVTRSARDIRRIEYARGDIEVVLENEPETGWRMTSPEAPESDQAAISNFVSALTMLEGGRFLNPYDDDVEIGEPEFEIALEFDDGEQPEPLQFGALSMAAGGEDEVELTRYATQDSGVAFAISEAATAALRVSDFDFRPRRVLPFAADEAAAVSMRFEGEDYRFEHDGERWAVSAPEGKTWDTQADMRTLLEAFAEAEAIAREESVIPDDLAPYGLDEPLLTAIIETDGGVFGPLRVGSPAEDNSQHRYATVEDRGELLRVRQALIETVRDALRGVVED